MIALKFARLRDLFNKQAALIAGLAWGIGA
jgi:hypothetical protein